MMQFAYVDRSYISLQIEPQRLFLNGCTGAPKPSGCSHTLVTHDFVLHALQSHPDRRIFFVLRVFHQFLVHTSRREDPIKISQQTFCIRQNLLRKAQLGYLPDVSTISLSSSRKFLILFLKVDSKECILAMHCIKTPKMVKICRTASLQVSTLWSVTLVG